MYCAGDKSARKLALVLPGKLDTKDYAHMRSHVDFLANKGFLAVSFDPPGTWESGGGIELYTMTNYLKAVDELIEYFGNKPTFVMGHSRGATISTIVGARNEKVVAFAAVMSRFTRGILTKQDDMEWESRGYHVSMRDLPPGGGEKTKEFRIPYSFFEDQVGYDLTDEIASTIKPKLFFLGTKDELVTPKLVREGFEEFAEPKVLHELDWDHDYRNSSEKIEEVNRVMGEFLEKYNI